MAHMARMAMGLSIFKPHMREECLEEDETLIRKYADAQLFLACRITKHSSHAPTQVNMQLIQSRLLTPLQFDQSDPSPSNIQ